MVSVFFLVFVLVSYGTRDKAVLAPRLLNQTGEAKAAIQRAFDSVQVTPTYTVCADVCVGGGEGICLSPLI